MTIDPCPRQLWRRRRVIERSGIVLGVFLPRGLDECVAPDCVVVDGAHCTTWLGLKLGKRWADRPRWVATAALAREDVQRLRPAEVLPLLAAARTALGGLGQGDDRRSLCVKHGLVHLARPLTDLEWLRFRQGMEN